MHTAAKKRLKAQRLKKQGDSCWFCLEPMGDDCTIEHVKPLSLGGKKHSFSNIRLMHQRCNQRVRNLPPKEKIAMKQDYHRKKRNAAKRERRRQKQLLQGAAQ